MSLVISKVFTYDTDAGNYIQAVEAADGQALEAGTRQAINNFVIGCKQDGIWNAIKASCILSGARTLNGALQPLVGTAPTNVGGLFVSGDYNRKTGLVGDGSTKYLDSNRNNNADPQDSKHIAVMVSVAGGGDRSLIGGFGGSSGGVAASQLNTAGQVRVNQTSNAGGVSAFGSATGLIGTSRIVSATISFRVSNSTREYVVASSTPANASIEVFGRNLNPGNNPTNARLAFYSIGESLDLALLDARVTALITAFGVAIP